jgi:hypothetical protein
MCELIFEGLAFCKLGVESLVVGSIWKEVIEVEVV